MLNDNISNACISHLSLKVFMYMQVNVCIVCTSLLGLESAEQREVQRCSVLVRLLELFAVVADLLYRLECTYTKD